MKMKILLLSILIVMTTTGLNTDGKVLFEKSATHPHVKNRHPEKEMTVKKTISSKQRQETEKPVMMNARIEHHF